MYQLNLDIAPRVLAEAPLLIKGGFTDFQDPISPDELAGLAMEEVIESRLVTRFNNKWEAAHGPFESYITWVKRTGPCWCRPATTGPRGHRAGAAVPVHPGLAF
jgi:hypothetical protein